MDASSIPKCPALELSFLSLPRTFLLLTLHLSPSASLHSSHGFINGEKEGDATHFYFHLARLQTIRRIYECYGFRQLQKNMDL